MTLIIKGDLHIYVCDSLNDPAELVIIVEKSVLCAIIIIREEIDNGFVKDGTENCALNSQPTIDLRHVYQE